MAKTSYNYILTDSNKEEVGNGTFIVNGEMDKWELTERAKRIAAAFFFNLDVTCDVYLCDHTSGDFNTIGGILATYTTKEW